MCRKLKWIMKETEKSQKWDWIKSEESWNGIYKETETEIIKKVEMKEIGVDKKAKKIEKEYKQIESRETKKNQIERLQKWE